MTKTIEFIEQATIANQRRLEQYKRDLEYYKKESGLIDYGVKIFHLKNDIKHIEEIVLPNLEQIKTILEAWEEMTKHEFEIDRLDSVAEYYVVHIWKPFKPEEIEIIKKALEVKNG